MGAHASFLYANNVLKLLALFVVDGAVAPDWSTTRSSPALTVARGGQVDHAPTAEALGVARVPVAPAPAEEA